MLPQETVRQYVKSMYPLASTQFIVKQKKNQTQIVYEMNNLYFRCFALHTIILFRELHYWYKLQ